MSPEKLSVEQLQSALKECVGTTKEKMAPLLYYLRLKLRKQGSRKGEGFDAWVKANLPFTRRTADTWANEWGVAHGLMKERTSRKISRSWVPHSPKEDDLYTIELAFGPDEHRAFLEASEILGAPETQRVIYEAVLAAAAKRKKPNAKAIHQPGLSNLAAASCSSAASA